MVLSPDDKKKLIGLRGGCESTSVTPCSGPIEIHHIDRNPKNDRLSNLKVYCKKHHPAANKSR